jgi:hypothetical protein
VRLLYLLEEYVVSRGIIFVLTVIYYELHLHTQGDGFVRYTSSCLEIDVNKETCQRDWLGNQI